MRFLSQGTKTRFTERIMISKYFSVPVLDTSFSIDQKKVKFHLFMTCGHSEPRGDHFPYFQIQAFDIVYL